MRRLSVLYAAAVLRCVQLPCEPSRCIRCRRHTGPTNFGLAQARSFSPVLNGLLGYCRNVRFPILTRR